MCWTDLCYESLAIAAAVVSTILAFLVWRRRPAPGATTFAFLMLILTEWSITAAAGALSSPRTHLLWDHFEYFGIVLVAPCWLIFTIQYIGWRKRLPPGRLALLFIIPLLTIIFVWTNDSPLLGQLIYRDTAFISNGQLSGLDITYGWWFWVHTGYSYLLIFAGITILLQAFTRFPNLYRRQAGALLIGLTFPWIANVMDITGMKPFLYLELTPLLLTLSGVAIAWSLFRLRLLDMMPVARDTLIENMDDGVIVLDSRQRVVDINPSARQFIGCAETEIVGQPLPSAWGEWVAGQNGLQDLITRSTEVIFGDEANVRQYEIRISPQQGPWRDLTVRLLLVRDVTAQRQMECALQNSERQFRETLLHIDLISVIIDLDGNITFCNDALLRATGRKREETLGQNWFRLFLPPELQEAFSDSYRKLLTSEIVPQPYESEIVTCWGARRLIRWNYSSFRDLEGRVTGITGIGEDITDRRKAENALRDSEEVLREITEHATEVVWLKTPDEVFYISSAYETIWGRSRKDVLTPPNSYLDGIHPDDRERVQEAVQSDDFHRTGLLDLRFRVIRPDGTLRWVRAQSLPVYNHDGSLRHIAGIAQDITTLTATEDALVYYETLYRLLFDQVNDMVFIYRLLADGTPEPFSEVNETACRVLGYPHEELLALRPDSLVQPPSPEDISTPPESSGLAQEVFLDKDGMPIPVDVRRHLLTSDGETVVLMIARDCLEKQQMLLDVKRANQDLEQFAYVASHDLQEPLRMVSSYVQLLAQRYQGKLDEKADKFIKYAVDGAGRMQELIQALLSYSRINTQAKPAEAVALDDILASVAQREQARWDELGVVVTHDALPTITADKAQLTLLLQHLLDNAVKFHGDAPPRIHISAMREGKTWQIGVQDNGIGIDTRYTERIFIIFQRLHTRNEYPGTGIGLAICKRIVERLGGNIRIESQPGEGTTIYFTLPAGERDLS